MDRKEDPVVGIYGMFNGGNTSSNIKIGEVTIDSPIQVVVDGLPLNQENIYINSIYFIEGNQLKKGDKVVVAHMNKRQKWVLLCKVI